MMISKYNITTKVIAGLLVAAFLLQDVVWANPEVFSKVPSPGTLQIQPLSSSISTGLPDPVGLIDRYMVQIFCISGKQLQVESIIGDFVRNETILRENVNGAGVIMYVGKPTIINGKYVIPSTAAMPGSAVEKFYTVVGTDRSVNTYRENELPGAFVSVPTPIPTPGVEIPTPGVGISPDPEIPPIPRKEGSKLIGLLITVASISLAALGVLALVRKSLPEGQAAGGIYRLIGSHAVGISVWLGGAIIIAVILNITFNRMKAKRIQAKLKEERFVSRRDYVERVRYEIRGREPEPKEVRVVFSKSKTIDLIKDPDHKKTTVGFIVLSHANPELKNAIVLELKEYTVGLIENKSTDGLTLFNEADDKIKNSILKALSARAIVFIRDAAKIELETFSEEITASAVKDKPVSILCDGKVRMGFGGRFEESPYEIEYSVIPKEDGTGNESQLLIFDKQNPDDTQRIARYILPLGITYIISGKGEQGWVDSDTCRIALDHDRVFEGVAFSVKMSEESGMYNADLTDRGSVLYSISNQGAGNWSMSVALTGLNFMTTAYCYRIARQESAIGVSGAKRGHIVIKRKSVPVKAAPAKEIAPDNIGKAYSVKDIRTDIQRRAITLSVKDRKTGKVGRIKLKLSAKQDRPAQLIPIIISEAKANKSLVRRILSSFPDNIFMRIYNNPPKDLFGFASFPHKMMAICSQFANDPVALFHEMGEYLIQAGMMKLGLKDGILTAEAGGLRESIDVKDILKQLKSEGEKWAPWSGASLNATDNAHYLLRILQRAVFKDADRRLTQYIKAFQAIEISKHDFNRLGLYKVKAMISSALQMASRGITPTINRIMKDTGLSKMQAYGLVTSIGWENMHKLGVRKGDDDVKGRLDDIEKAIEWLDKHRPAEEITFPLLTGTMQRLGFGEIEPYSLRSWLYKQRGKRPQTLIDSINYSIERRCAARCEMSLEVSRALAKRECKKRLGISISAVRISKKYRAHLRSIIVSVHWLSTHGQKATVKNIADRSGLSKYLVLNVVGRIGDERAGKFGIIVQVKNNSGERMQHVRAALTEIYKNMPAQGVSVALLSSTIKTLKLENVCGRALDQWLKRDQGREIYDEIKKTQKTIRDLAIDLMKKKTTGQLIVYTEEQLRADLSKKEKAWEKWARTNKFDFDKEKKAMLEEKLARAEEAKEESLSDRTRDVIEELAASRGKNHDRIAELAELYTPEEIRLITDALWARAQTLDRRASRSKEKAAAKSMRDDADNIYGRTYLLLRESKANPELEEKVKKIVFDRYEYKGSEPKIAAPVRLARKNSAIGSRYDKLFEDLEAEDDPYDAYSAAQNIFSRLEKDEAEYPGFVRDYMEKLHEAVDEIGVEASEKEDSELDILIEALQTSITDFISRSESHGDGAGAILLLALIPGMFFAGTGQDAAFGSLFAIGPCWFCVAMGLVVAMNKLNQINSVGLPEPKTKTVPAGKLPTILESAEINMQRAAKTMELDPALWDIISKPKRVTTVKFNIPLEDGTEETFWAFRALQNDARGAGKGGLRWLVGKGETLEEAKETAVGLATLMSVKNAVIGIPYGGGKGDVFVNNRPYTDNDKARIIRGFSRELTGEHAIGTFIDVPAPDKGTDARMMAWFMDEYLNVLAQKGQIHDKAIQKILKVSVVPSADPQATPYLDKYIRILAEDADGVLEGIELGMVTGKPVGKGGSEGRTKATGLGGFIALKETLRYFTGVDDFDSDAIGKALNAGVRDLVKKNLNIMTAGIQGTGNVGEYHAWELFRAGVGITKLQDETMTIYNPNGIDIEWLNECLERRADGRWAPLNTVAQKFFERPDRPGSELAPNDGRFWTEHSNIMVVAATENQITPANVDDLACEIVLELANNPTTPEADKALRRRGILVIPDVLANVGGVTVSYFEWLQNIEGKYWSEESVDKMLEERIRSETKTVIDVARQYGVDFRQAAFILSLARIADAEIARSSALRKKFTSIMPYKGYHELDLEPETVEELRALHDDGIYADLIDRNEKRHSDEIAGIVSRIDKKFDRIKNGFVLISGPITSGKIAFSDRVASGLKSLGRNAVKIDMDLQFNDDDDALRILGYSEDEIYDSHIADINSMLTKMLEGKAVRVRVHKDGMIAYEAMKCNPDDILVLEGEHVLGRGLIDKEKGFLKDEQTFGIFVNTVPSLKLAGNRPLTSLDMRFIRHILTFTGIFGSKPLDVIRLWPDLRAHNLKYVYPTKDNPTWQNADATFNSYLPYELPVLKPHIVPVLRKALVRALLKRDRRSIKMIKHLLSVFKGVPSIKMDAHIPRDSILRQFIPNENTDKNNAIPQRDDPQAPPAAVPFDFSKVKRPVMDEPFLRDPLDEKSLTQSMVNGITSIVLQRKLVIILDNKLGGAKRAKVLKMFDEIEDVKKRDDIFGALWRGRIETRTSLSAIDEFKDDKTAEVFVFAQDGPEQRTSVLQKASVLPAEHSHTTFINENGIPPEAYYPLFEIVTIAIADFLDPRTMELVKPLMERMNIAEINTVGGILTFILLPRAERIDPDKEFPDRYRRLTQLLIAA